MTDYLEIANAPIEEPQVQVRKDTDYYPAMCRESTAFLHQIQRLYPTAHLRIKSFPHDFGSYTEVVCDIDDTGTKRLN